MVNSNSIFSFTFQLSRYLQWLIPVTLLVLMNEMVYAGSTASVEGVFDAKSWLELAVNSGFDHWTWALGSA